MASSSGDVEETLKMQNIFGTLKKLITKRGGAVKAEAVKPGTDGPGSALLKEVLTTINTCMGRKLTS